MQQPSPALSSPSTGFFGSRASPLFTQTVDQPDPPLGDVSSSSLLHPSASTSVGSSSSENGGQQAPPKQLAQAMEALSHAVRIIADVRVGSDNILEALQRSSSFKSAHPSSSSAQASAFIARVSDEISASLDDLRATGKKLDALGVMNGAQQRFEEKHPWGLQVPLICSDGAIVAYSWKRQIAGQAAASAVERTRLALKAFTDQKRRFFQSGEEGNVIGHSDKRAKYWGGENGSSLQSSPLLELLKLWQAAEGSGMIISAFSRLEWAKHKLASARQKKSFHTGFSSADSGLKPGLDASSVENVAILEVTVPAVFKAVVSLFPSGSVTPDAVSLFSADEVCNNAHLGSSSTHAVFRRVSECATSALHFFLQAASASRASSLHLLLYWLYTYKSLFSKPCSQCKRVLALDGPSDVLLPPLVRPAPQILRVGAAASSLKLEDLNDEKLIAYHLSCISKEDSH